MESFEEDTYFGQRILFALVVLGLGGTLFFYNPHLDFQFTDYELGHDPESLIFTFLYAFAIMCSIALCYLSFYKPGKRWASFFLATLLGFPMGMLVMECVFMFLLFTIE